MCMWLQPVWHKNVRQYKGLWNFDGTSEFNDNAMNVCILLYALLFMYEDV